MNPESDPRVVREWVLKPMRVRKWVRERRVPFKSSAMEMKGGMVRNCGCGRSISNTQVFSESCGDGGGTGLEESRYIESRSLSAVLVAERNFECGGVAGGRRGKARVICGYGPPGRRGRSD